MADTAAAARAWSFPRRDDTHGYNPTRESRAERDRGAQEVRLTAFGASRTGLAPETYRMRSDSPTIFDDPKRTRRSRAVIGESTPRRAYELSDVEQPGGELLFEVFRSQCIAAVRAVYEVNVVAGIGTH